jgi:ubiquinol-cytochrome c reductase cytochrome c subunit
VRFLSARRRHPLAGLVVVLLGLFVAAGVYAALAPSSDANASNEDLVSKGHQIFLVGCATCHGLNGEGTMTSADTNYGPSLVGVGAAAVDFQVGTGRMPMAQPGTQALAKPPQYDTAEIEALAAYIASLGPGPSVPDAKYYDVSNATQEQVVNGGELFRTNCTACHNFAGAGGALPGGKYAPSLSGVTNKHIFEALLTGPQQMPVFSNGVLKPSEKRDIIAYLNSVHAAPKYGGSNLGSYGPVTEGLFAWLIGIGACVAFAVWIASHSARSTRSKKGASA